MAVCLLRYLIPQFKFLNWAGLVLVERGACADFSLLKSSCWTCGDVVTLVVGVARVDVIL